MPASSRLFRPSRAAAAALALSIGAGALALTAAPTAAAATGTVVLNEVESSGGSPGDWVELTNTGTAPVDVSGYVVRDNDDSTTKQVLVPAGTTLAPGAFLAVDTDPTFGLGSTDSARLYAADGTTLLDSYAWTAHAATTYGRCPDGVGAFTTTASPTKGAANACTTTTPPPAVRTDAVTWPGGPDVTVADDAGVLGEDLSGLFYEASGTSAPGVLWAVKNDPGVLYRLLWNGTVWTPDTTNGWAAGKQLRYPDGTGEPDSEGVTLIDGNSADGIFVATERDNANDTVSRPAILRFDASAPGTTLTASALWDMTADLPAVGPNLGFEALTWVPDTALAGSLTDTTTGAAYDPNRYPAHGAGLFLAGLEADGTVYAYALDQRGTAFTRVTSFGSGFPTVMELQYDPAVGGIRAICDNTCAGQQTVLRPAGGSYAVTAAYDRPAGLPDVNNEGFAVAPDALCVNGVKPAIWADDDGTDDHALRQGTIACTVTPPTGGGGTGGGNGTGQGGGAAPILAVTGAAVPATTGLGLALLALGTVLLVGVGRRRRV